MQLGHGRMLGAGVLRGSGNGSNTGTGSGNSSTGSAFAYDGGGEAGGTAARTVNACKLGYKDATGRRVRAKQCDTKATRKI